MKKIIIPKEFAGQVYFTADTHFYHSNVINFCGRPFIDTGEMNTALITNWNSLVTEHDIVFHLGDFALTDRYRWKMLCKQLNGTIYLIQGNHDHKNKIYHEGFASVDDILQLTIYDCESEKWKTLILCHYCLTTWPGQWQGTWHCFGHSHTNPVFSTQLDNTIITNRPLPSYDVGVDNNNFYPISFNELKIIFKQQLLYGQPNTTTDRKRQ